MAGPLGNITGGVVGAGVGIAASNVAEPVLEVERQQAWKDNAYRVLELGDLARLVAQGLAKLDDAAEHALRNGYDQRKLAARVQLELKAPSLAEVLTLWRRGRFGPPDPANPPEQVTHALAKEQIEPQYWTAVLDLFFDRLNPSLVATAIQRGVMKAPFALPYNVDVPVGNITPFPVSPLDAGEEAKAQGIDLERLRIETALIGLPMALDRAARAKYRGILTEGDFLRAVLEGNSRGEWAEAELEVAREIPTAHDGVEMRLRGWYDTDAEMYAQTARHGMTEADTDILFKVTGRPLSWHQVFIGLRRGGIYNGPTDQIDPAFLKALRESNIRPEWYNLAWAQRFNLPSVFVIRQFLKDGGDPAWAQEKLWQEGWQQSDIDVLIKEYAPKATAKADTRVTSAQTKLITGIEKAFVGGVLDPAQAAAQLEQAGLSATTVSGMLAHWQQLKMLEATQPPAAA